MNREKNGLTKREKLFCQNYVQLGNGREAAARSGYALFPEQSGTKLIGEEKIQREIARITEENGRRARVDKTITGYERLAFGGIADAVKLALSGEVSPEELETMDLFTVSGIKRQKEGLLEIQFYDRLKALEKLREMSRSDGEEQSSFLIALERGAMAVNGTDQHEV